MWRFHRFLADSEKTHQHLQVVVEVPRVPPTQWFNHYLNWVKRKRRNTCIIVNIIVTSRRKTTEIISKKGWFVWKCAFVGKVSKSHFLICMCQTSRTSSAFVQPRAPKQHVPWSHSFQKICRPSDFVALTCGSPRDPASNPFPPPPNLCCYMKQVDVCRGGVFPGAPFCSKMWMLQHFIDCSVSLFIFMKSSF